MSKQLTIGIVVAENGLPHFSGVQIAAVARELGATDDEAAQLVGKLLARAYRAERPEPSRAVLMLRGER